MPVQQMIPYNDGIFFITFTCDKWLPLIEMTSGYNLFIQNGSIFKNKAHKYGYITIPNHVLYIFEDIE